MENHSSLERRNRHPTLTPQRLPPSQGLRMNIRILFSLCSNLGLVAAWVQINPSLVPVVDFPLPILALGVPASLPLNFLTSLVQNIDPRATFTPNSTFGSGLYAFSNSGRLLGLTNDTNGETHIFPDFTQINPTFHYPIDTKRILESVLGLDEGHSHNRRSSETQAFPLDDTAIKLIRSSNVLGVQYTPDTNSSNPSSQRRRSKFPSTFPIDAPIPNGNATLPRAFLSYGILDRSVHIPNGQTFSVCGPGSLAKFGVSPTQQVVSVAYAWRPASFVANRTSFITPNSTSTVIAAIKRHFEDQARDNTGTLNITNVDLCYYDPGNFGNFMQPVYRVKGRWIGSGRQLQDLLGYLPAGARSPESIGRLSDLFDPDRPIEPTLHLPAERRAVLKPPARGPALRRQSGSPITLGRYVIRSPSISPVHSANSFRRSLLASPLNPIESSQYFWSYPFIYGPDEAISDLYINSVHVALTEAHSNQFRLPHQFTTLVSSSSPYSEPNDPVSFDTGIPPGGYGSRTTLSDGTPGKLAFWFLNSPEIIPSLLDYPSMAPPQASLTAIRYWAPLFKGLHAILGFRTETILEDNVVAKAAELAAKGVPVVNAWMTAAATDAAYVKIGSQGVGYFSDAIFGVQPYGKASVVVKCGRENDMIWDVEVDDDGCGYISMLFDDNDYEGIGFPA